MRDPTLPEKVIYDSLSLLGAGVVKDCVQDYSASASDWYFEPLSTQVVIVKQLLIAITDNSGMLDAEYANLGAALTNGIDLKLFTSSGTIADLTDGTMIKTNEDYRALVGPNNVEIWGTTNEIMTVNWSFKDHLNGGLVLDGSQGHRLGFTANDNFTAIGSHRFYVRGYDVT